MSEDHYEYEDGYCREEREENSEVYYTDKTDVIQKTPWWMVSMVLHAAFIFAAMMWTVSQDKVGDDINIIEVDIAKFVRPEYETVRREITKNHKMIETENVVEEAVIPEENVHIDDDISLVDVNIDDEARGDENMISVVDLKGDGWDGVFGTFGNPSGMYGERGKGKKGGRRYGLTPKTENAVEAALGWFKRHQAPDGSWSFAWYHEHCKEVPACENLDLEADYHNWDNAATGFALLCFLGAGHTHKGGRYRKQVADGLAFLQKAQQDDGSFSRNNYVHSITTMALAEAYGMTRDVYLKDRAQKAVDVIIARQNEYLGWDYAGPSSRNDTSVTGWNIMALKSAMSSKLNIQNAFEGCKQVLEKVTPEVRGYAEARLADDIAYQYFTDKDDHGHRNPTMTSIGLLSRVFLGQNTKGRVLRAHANRMLEHIPSRYERGDFYQWYYATYGMFQMGGDYWKKWCEGMKPVLCENQRTKGCADGSWDPTEKWSCQRGGRLFATALGCLTLEVFYRYPVISTLNTTATVGLGKNKGKI